MDNNLVAISREGVFTLEQAIELTPLVRRITQDYAKQVETMMARLETIDLSQEAVIQSLEMSINERIQEWHTKIRKLGGVPKGLWLVDFDAGDGYFCWKFPEETIMYWHSYQDGFTGRIPLAERPVKNKKPVRKDSSEFETLI